MKKIMEITDIAFPKLGIYFEDVPKTFSVFGFEIAFYGVIIAFGFFVGLQMALYIAKKTEQKQDNYWDFFMLAVIFSIIGARAYYVFFAWDSYKDNILNVFNIRQGGLAIYGGVIAAFITGVIFCKIMPL